MRSNLPPLTVRRTEQVARSLNVTVAARATHRVSIPTTRVVGYGKAARTVEDWRLVRGVEYVLTGGSSYGRETVADLMVGAIPGAVVVHVSPFTFVRTITAERPKEEEPWTRAS